MTRSPSPFASRTVMRHLLRGAAGLLAVAGALLMLRGGGPLGVIGTLPPLALAVILFRGCPMCWTVGLIETVTSHAGTRTNSFTPAGHGDRS